MFCNKNCPTFIYYSLTCLGRPLSWGTTCLEGPHSRQKVPHFNVNEPVTKDHLFWWDHIFHNQQDGLSGQVLLYINVSPMLKLIWTLASCEMWTYYSRKYNCTTKRQTIFTLPLWLCECCVLARVIYKKYFVVFMARFACTSSPFISVVGNKNYL